MNKEENTTKNIEIKDFESNIDLSKHKENINKNVTLKKGNQEHKGKSKGKKKGNDISIISLRVLDCFKNYLDMPITYSTLKNELKDYFADTTSDNDKVKYIRKAIEILKKANYNIETIKSPLSFIYRNESETKLKNLINYMIVKSGYYKNFEDFKYNYGDYTKKYDMKNYQRHFITQFDSIRKVEKMEGENLQKIIEALETNKSITFTYHPLSNRKQDISFKPLSILIDEHNDFYVSIIFQPNTSKHYVLDFVKIVNMESLKIKEEWHYNYANLKSLASKHFPFYLEYYPELFDSGNLESLSGIFSKKLYNRHSCTIQYRNEDFAIELEKIFEDIDTEYIKEENYNIYYSHIYYQNEKELFEWIYQKKLKQDNIYKAIETKEKEIENLRDKFDMDEELRTKIHIIKEEIEQLLIEGKQLSIVIANADTRKRYGRYEIAKIKESTNK